MVLFYQNNWSSSVSMRWYIMIWLIVTRIPFSLRCDINIFIFIIIVIFIFMSNGILRPHFTNTLPKKYINIRTCVCLKNLDATYSYRRAKHTVKCVCSCSRIYTRSVFIDTDRSAFERWAVPGRCDWYRGITIGSDGYKCENRSTSTTLQLSE